MTRITIENIQKNFTNGRNTTKVLEGINIDIAPGEFFFLLGPSGCGKTTLLRIIAGLIEPTGGRILFDGKDVTALDARKRNCALVFQNYALWPHMTVLKNTEFGLEMKGVSGSERHAEAMGNLELVEMAELAARKPTQLSGGQQQRVALARAITSRPDCLLLDEPLSNLDAKLRLQMRQQLRKLVKAAGHTAIYVTHDQKEALAMADRIAVLNNGVIEQTGTAREIYEYPKSAFVAAFIGECNFIKGTIISKGDVVTVKTPLGTLTASPKKDSSTGAGVLCGLRPEDVVLSSAPLPQADNLLAAKVAAVTYLGEVTQVDLDMPDQSRWKSFMISSNTESFEQGQTVSISIYRSSLIIVDA